MSSGSVCQVACSWVDMGSFHMCLFEVVYVTCGDFHNGSGKGTASMYKICANLGKSATETLTKIQQAFGDQILSCIHMLQWHAWFKTSCTSVDNDEHTRRPTSYTTPENVAWIQELIHQDRHPTFRNIAEVVGIGYGACQQVLTKELGMYDVAASPWQHHVSLFCPYPAVSC
jgi:hypothetical protein